MTTTFRWQSSAGSDVGCVRELNEDAYLVRDDCGVWLVMDGMGGHAGGDVASRLVADAFDHMVPARSMAELEAEVVSRLHSANRAILEERVRGGDARMMGTTVVAVLACGSRFACYWAGDSRAYLLRGNDLYRLTRDHSVVQELVDNGTLSEQEAREHPASNQITNAMGVSDELELAQVEASLQDGDIMLMCTDGLYNELTEAEIGTQIRCGNVRAAVEELVKTAVERGARDNVTAVMISFEENTLVGYRPAP